VDLIFDELDTNKDRMLELNEFLKPSWGKVQELLNKAFIKINNLQQLPQLGGDAKTKEDLLRRLDELENAKLNNGDDNGDDGDSDKSKSFHSSEEKDDDSSISKEEVVQKVPKIVEPKVDYNDITENDCSVCMDDVKNSVFIPCGHISCCLNCAVIIQESDNPICPICDARIESVHHIFVV